MVCTGPGLRPARQHFRAIFRRSPGGPPPAAPITLVRLAPPQLVPVVLIRKQDGRGYQLLIQPQLSDYPQDDEMAATCYMNRIVEQEILRAPDQYLWLHRRFKTRPWGELCRCMCNLLARPVKACGRNGVPRFP